MSAEDWLAEQAAECDLHGPYTATRSTRFDRPGRAVPVASWSRCPLCVAGLAAAEQARSAADAEAKERRRRANLLDNASIPPRFADVGLDAFKSTMPAQHRAWDACSNFAASVQKDSGGGLLLLGRPGTGKTMLSVAIARSVIVNRGISARIIGARDLVRELRATWRRDAQRSEDDVIEDLAQVHLLVIDDIGVGFGSDKEQTQLLDVIDRRYQRRRPTVCSSNLNMPGLSDAIGERALDRLREDARIVLFEWPSYRRPAGAALA